VPGGGTASSGNHHVKDSPRGTSGGHRIGLVECPACKADGPSKGCELCGGAGRVGVDAAIAWREARDSLLPADRTGSQASTADVLLLLDNVEIVLRAVATMPTSEEARALTERALSCERGVKAWTTAPPTRVECDAMTKRVLGLHIALRKMQSSD
jgi:hypothetical protein